MRIVIASPNDHAESHANYLYRALVRMKNVPFIYDYRVKGISGLQSICDFHEADVLLVLKGEIVIPSSIKNVKAKKVLWCPDDPFRTYIALQKYDNKPWGSYYDLVVTHSFKALNLYKKAGLNATYLPFAFDPILHYPDWKAKQTKNIGFVGNIYPSFTEHGQKAFNRKELLERIWNVYKNKMYLVRAYFDAKRLFFQKTKINLNVPGCNQVNVRHIEICACGGFQLSYHTEEAEKFFGKNIIFWKDVPDCLEKIQYYLNNEEERKKIAKKGYNFIKKKGDYAQRLRTIFKLLKKKM